MGSSPDSPNEEASLQRALGQSELVQDKVAQAATDLSSVNAVLKDEVAEGTPVANVKQALEQCEAVELNVQEAAEELVAVNDALALEIDERHRLEQRLAETTAALSVSRSKERRSRHTAMHDAVTGLPNLSLFNDRLSHALAQAKRHRWRLAVLFIDLDDFKGINDLHGHTVGDELLLIVSQRLQAAVRASDTVSRRSGDEFLLLMLEAKEESMVAVFAAGIATLIAASCDIRGLSLNVTASIGIALYPDDGISGDVLLNHADAAMYVAKQHKQGPVFYRSVGQTDAASALPGPPDS